MKSWYTGDLVTYEAPQSALRADIRRAYKTSGGSPLQRFLACCRSPSVQAMVAIRFGQWALKCPKPVRVLLDPLYVLLNLYVEIVWGIEISRQAKIGPGLYIAHFGGITVSPDAVIGSDCNLSQNVTIGVGGHGAKAGVPVIGDNVYIAPGARLFGKITVGKNVKIGANAVVYRDIPDNAIVVLDPGYRIISYRGNRSIRPKPQEAPTMDDRSRFTH